MEVSITTVSVLWNHKSYYVPQRTRRMYVLNLFGLYHMNTALRFPQNIADLMLSAILSDTLAFRSLPALQPTLPQAGLNEICGEDESTFRADV